MSERDPGNSKSSQQESFGYTKVTNAILNQEAYNGV